MSKVNYLSSWFYQETEGEASYYPQMGRKGSSPLAKSVYMQIQVPFFVSFKHHNPDCRFLFFTNVAQLPEFLDDLFRQLDVEVVRLDYNCAPPKGWYHSWANQFYLYDILRYMEGRMDDDDTFTVIDADCICHKPLASFFDRVRREGSGLYVEGRDAGWVSSDLNQMQMEEIYRNFYGQEPTKPLYYYGGEFISLRGDKLRLVNEAYAPLWHYNLQLFREDRPKLNQEALFFSVLAEHLSIRNDFGNEYIRRMWTNPNHFDCRPADLDLSIWHLPYEKRRGLRYLYYMLRKQGNRIVDEQDFLRRAARYCGVPSISIWKKLRDLRQKSIDIFIR